MTDVMRIGPPEQNDIRRVGRREVVKRIGLVGAVGAVAMAVEAAPADAAALHPGTGAGRACIYIDDYASDPTGKTSSASAWTAAYADAVSAVTAASDGPHAGINIVFGPGVYQFPVNTAPRS